jgi:hypothetical protein
MAADTVTTLRYKSEMTITEILAGNSVGLSDKSVIHSTLNKSATLTNATTPPVTLVATFRKALAAGVGTIDLTALVGTNSGAIDGTGLKVQAIKFVNPATNANTIKIAKGASNGYALAGTDFAVTLSPGQEFVMYGNDATPDIAAGAKTFDLTGTLVQVLDVSIAMG